MIKNDCQFHWSSFNLTFQSWSTKTQQEIFSWSQLICFFGIESVNSQFLLMHGRDPAITNKSGEYAIKRNDEIEQCRGKTNTRIIKMFRLPWEIQYQTIRDRSGMLWAAGEKESVKLIFFKALKTSIFLLKVWYTFRKSCGRINCWVFR